MLSGCLSPTTESETVGKGPHCVFKHLQEKYSNMSLFLFTHTLISVFHNLKRPLGSLFTVSESVVNEPSAAFQSLNCLEDNWTYGCPRLTDGFGHSLQNQNQFQYIKPKMNRINVYACLVCGKYFQGRGNNTHAYTHRLTTIKQYVKVIDLIYHTSAVDLNPQCERRPPSLSKLGHSQVLLLAWQLRGHWCLPGRHPLCSQPHLWQGTDQKIGNQHQVNGFLIQGSSLLSFCVEGSPEPMMGRTTHPGWLGWTTSRPTITLTSFSRH